MLIFFGPVKSYLDRWKFYLYWTKCPVKSKVPLEWLLYWKLSCGLSSHSFLGGRGNDKWSVLYAHAFCVLIATHLRHGCRAPDKLRICVFYAIKTSKNACIIRSECTHYAYILLCKQTFQILNVLVQSCTWQYIFVFEKFPVITSLNTFRRREHIHPKGTESLPF